MSDAETGWGGNDGGYLRACVCLDCVDMHVSCSKSCSVGGMRCSRTRDAGSGSMFSCLGNYLICV